MKYAYISRHNCQPDPNINMQSIILALLLFIAAALANGDGSKHSASDFICINDTKFKHFINEVDFVIESCPPGFCFTRNPPNKNPCIGRELALKIDGQENGSENNNQNDSNDQEDDEEDDSGDNSDDNRLYRRRFRN